MIVSIRVTSATHKDHRVRGLGRSGVRVGVVGEVGVYRQTDRQTQTILISQVGVQGQGGVG